MATPEAVLCGHNRKGNLPEELFGVTERRGMRMPTGKYYGHLTLAEAVTQRLLAAGIGHIWAYVV